MAENQESDGGAKRTHGSRYPWTEWFAEGWILLERGAHYKCSTVGMIANIRRAAKLHGVRVSVDCAKDGSSIVLRVREEPAHV